MTPRAALRRLSVTPFETAIAWLLIVSGVASALNFGVIDPVSALLPGWEAAALSVMSAVTGGLMLAGAGIPHRGAETAGLVLLCGVVLARFLLYGFYLGFGSNFAVTGVFDVAIVWAAAARLVTIARREVLVRVSEPPQ
jgi:hypothetical protein